VIPENAIRFRCLRLQCGQLPVVVGSGRASDLVAASFADVLDEVQQTGYQRPFDSRHSREFREYIEKAGAATIPLTFNLRGREGQRWQITPLDASGQFVELAVALPGPGEQRVMAQVDCQHRLGHMTDSAVELTFQCFLGLTAVEEMAIFSVINGKAKGLSSSLLDYHTTKLTPGLETVQLDLYIAKTLHDDASSVWFQKLKLGGATPGTKRRVSLRSMQTATKLLLQRSPFASASELLPLQKYEIVRDFWAAVSVAWPSAWAKPRNHLLIKCVGVTALSMLAGDLITALLAEKRNPDATAFAEYLTALSDLDWSTEGAFKGYGGRHGATEAHRMLSRRLFAPGLAMVGLSK
jgi:DNA sulfur modification protein DndB